MWCRMILTMYGSRYFGENNAKAYATGVEMRLVGEWVKDAESWLSIGIHADAREPR